MLFGIAKQKSVFSTAFELRGADIILFFFMRGKKKWGEIFFGVKNVVLLKFDRL
jgi:hypothetical protein